MSPLDEAIEEELVEATTEGFVSLELPLPLAKQLIKMFGPVAFHISPGNKRGLRPIHTKRQRRKNRTGFDFCIGVVLGQHCVASVVHGQKLHAVHTQRWCR